MFNLNIKNSMERLLKIIYKISKGLNNIASVMLAFMILLTVADVILRSVRMPILGTYEMVGLLGAIIIGFSIPLTSWMKAHVRVDFFLFKFSATGRRILNIITRCLGIALFLIIGWNLIILGIDIYRVGEVTPTRHIPFYPVFYGVGASCFFQCIVLLCDIVKIFRGEYE